MVVAYFSSLLSSTQVPKLLPKFGEQATKMQSSKFPTEIYGGFLRWYFHEKLERRETREE